MSDVFAGIEPMVLKSKISVPYHWWAGETATRFFRALQSDGKITATKCSLCGKIYVPPRKVCPACFEGTMEWVDLPGTGELLSFTVARRQLASMPEKAPLVYGLVKLDGADTALLHFIGGVAPDAVKIGMRVAVRFAEKRTGTIRDIECFRPV